MWPGPRLWEKIVGICVPLGWGFCGPLFGELAPCLTQCGQGGGYTFMPSGILIHPNVWPQYTNVPNNQSINIRLLRHDKTEAHKRET